jgi:hypothetical protein
MFPSIFPFPTILFQSLFLLVAIAIEAVVLHQQMKWSRRICIHYAAIVNLFAAFLGWVGFFIIFNYLSPLLKAQIISYIFFNRLFDYQQESASGLIVLAGFSIFFAAFAIKLKAIDFLQIILQPPPTPVPENQVVTTRQQRKSKSHRRFFVINHNNKAMAVLVANACSHTAILLILFIYNWHNKP